MLEEFALRRGGEARRLRQLALHEDFLLGEGTGADLARANPVAGLKLGDIWTSLSPRGTLAFSADVEVLEHALASKPTPIKDWVEVQDASVLKAGTDETDDAPRHH